MQLYFKNILHSSLSVLTTLLLLSTIWTISRVLKAVNTLDLKELYGYFIFNRISGRCYVDQKLDG